MEWLNRLRAWSIIKLGGYVAPTIIGDVHVYGDNPSFTGIHIHGSIKVIARSDWHQEQTRAQSMMKSLANPVEGL